MFWNGGSADTDRRRHIDEESVYWVFPTPLPSSPFFTSTAQCSAVSDVLQETL